MERLVFYNHLFLPSFLSPLSIYTNLFFSSINVRLWFMKFRGDNNVNTYKLWFCRGGPRRERCATPSLCPHQIPRTGFRRGWRKKGSHRHALLPREKAISSLSNDGEFITINIREGMNSTQLEIGSAFSFLRRYLSARNDDATSEIFYRPLRLCIYINIHEFVSSRRRRRSSSIYTHTWWIWKVIKFTRAIPEERESESVEDNYEARARAPAPPDITPFYLSTLACTYIKAPSRGLIEAP